MKATHWSHSDDPEQWLDDPDRRPEDAAERFLVWEDDAAWDHRHDLIREGKCNITVYGYRETSDLLPEECWFDSYEPGCTYFAPTGEELVVEVRRTMSVKESNPERSGPTADAASKPDVAGSADAKLLDSEHLPEK